MFGAAIAAELSRVVVEIWPENWLAFDLFARLRTQWNVGMSGPTGLRYESAYHLIARIADSPERWDELFADLQTLEEAALKAMRDD